MQAATWSRSCRHTLAVFYGPSCIVETRLAIVVNQSLVQYALAEEESGVAPMKSICCVVLGQTSPS